MPFVRWDLDLDGQSELYFVEGLYPDHGQWYKVQEILFPTGFWSVGGWPREDGPQGLVMFRTKEHGVVTVINDAVQTTALRDDEAYYHEVTHCAINSSVEPPESVLIIGSDGGMLREVVKYLCVKRIVAVDIDRRSIDLAKEFMPSLSDGAWDDDRVQLVIADGAEFVRRLKEQDHSFDLIIVDSPDPVGCARSLFTPEFNHDLAAILKPGGIVMRQTGSSVKQPDEMPANYWKMRTAFPNGDVCVLVTAVSSYIGGYFTFVMASPQKNVFNVSKEIIKLRFQRRINPVAVGSLRWYSPEMHRAALTLPVGLKKDLEGLEWGRELLLDLYGCDFSVMTSPGKIAEFKREMCQVIGMKTYGEVVVTPAFGEGKTRTAGFSSLQWIETSSLVGHYADHLRIVFQDIFTCAKLEAVAAVKFAMEFFGAEEAFWLVVPRGRKAPQPEKEILAHLTRRDEDLFTTTDFPFILDSSQIRTYQM